MRLLKGWSIFRRKRIKKETKINRELNSQLREIGQQVDHQLKKIGYFTKHEEEKQPQYNIERNN